MTNRDIRKAVKPLRGKVLTEAARLADEEGEASDAEVMRDIIAFCCDEEEGTPMIASFDPSTELLAELAITDDDRETRCLAFLFLNEILKDHTK